MILIDGSFGEGGGQILRSSLSLSMVTGQPFKIINIREKRKKGGLLRQHLTAVNASIEISNARAEGAHIGATELTFIPGQVKAGKYHFAISTAGSATLVFQTIFPALMLQNAESELVLEGGTHNPFAPPYDFLINAFLPVMAQLGVEVKSTIERYGFYPAGGGKFSLKIKGTDKLGSVDLREKQQEQQASVRGIVSKIPVRIAEDEVKLIAEAFGWPFSVTTAEEVVSPGPGNALMAKLSYGNVNEFITGFGEKNVPLRKVAQNVIAQLQRYLKSGAPVGRFLADQLLIPMAIAGQGSFITLTPTQHTLTNMEIIKKFMAVAITCEEIGKDLYEINVMKG